MAEAPSTLYCAIQGNTSPHLLCSAEVDALVCSTADHADLPFTGYGRERPNYSHRSHPMGPAFPLPFPHTLPLLSYST